MNLVYIPSDASMGAADKFRERGLAALAMYGVRVYARLPAGANAHPTL